VESKKSDGTLNNPPSVLNPKPQTKAQKDRWNPEPLTLNSKLSTLNQSTKSQMEP
jgi:hypothetical protein